MTVELVDSQLLYTEFFLECRLLTSRLHYGQKDNNTLLYRYGHCFYNLLHVNNDARDCIVPGKAFVTPPEINMQQYNNLL